jgi:hypothetical protein
MRRAIGNDLAVSPINGTLLHRFDHRLAASFGAVFQVLPDLDQRKLVTGPHCGRRNASDNGQLASPEAFRRRAVQGLLRPRG